MQKVLYNNSQRKEYKKRRIFAYFLFFIYNKGNFIDHCDRMATKAMNIIYDTNYTSIIPHGWMVPYTPKKSWNFIDNFFSMFSTKQDSTKNTQNGSQGTTETDKNQPLNNGIEAKKENQKEEKSEWTTKEKKESRFDTLLWNIFGTENKKKTTEKPTTEKGSKPGNNKKENLQNKIKEILTIPDEEFNDKMITSDIRQYISNAEKDFSKTMVDFKSHIAPSYREVKNNVINISWILWKCYYTASYPTYMDALWTRDIFSIHAKWDCSFFIYPEDDTEIQSVLKRKTTQLRSEINDAMQKWMTIDKELEQQYKDVEMIRDKLSTKEERYFEFSNYFTIYESDENLLFENSKKYEQKIGGFGVRVKNATHRMDEGFCSTLPICTDDLWISRSSVTTSLAGSFPFISNDLVSSTGILYGLNLHTWWLVIFDRFNSKLPNMNSVILATSGAWKSFTVKLEILRYLLNGIDIIVIDPENEFKDLAKAVWGTYVNIATNSQQFINPFDLPPKIKDVEYGKWDLLRSQIMNLIGLLQIMLWDMSTEEEAILDKAIQNTYALKGFSFEDEEYLDKKPPIMGDLLNVLEGMDGWRNLSLKISKYVDGTFGKLFNNYTNIDINNHLTVFSIRDLEDALKTPAMFNVLNFIWTKVRAHKKQRLLICDEAWILLQHDTSANFLFGLIKRARKYWLWITTISQDIEDFVKSKYGKPIISNSSLQILLRQSTTSIKSLNDLLGLSEAEQQRLISWWIGEWLIFAGDKHIAVKITASPSEMKFITTDVKKDD